MLIINCNSGTVARKQADGKLINANDSCCISFEILESILIVIPITMSLLVLESVYICINIDLYLYLFILYYIACYINK